MRMAVYVYEGVDVRGRRQLGCIEARDRMEAAARLREKLPAVISLHRRSLAKVLWDRRPGQGHDRFRLAFSHQMHIMLGAGLPVLEAVRIFAGDLDAAHKKSMERLLQHLADGYSLSESMGLLGHEFSRTMIAMVQGGELSGNLADVFGRMHRIFRKRQETLHKLALAMAYPCLLCAIGAVLVVFLLCQVLPVFAEVFAGFGAELPGTTRLLLALSDDFGLWAALLAAGGLLALGVVQAGRKINWLGMRLGRLALWLPVWGRLKLRSEQATFLSVLAMMAYSGIRLHQGMGIARNMSRNMYWQFACDSMSVQLEQGYSLGVCLEKSGLFPAVVLSMIKAGEQSGELARMLECAGESCQREAELLLERLNVLAEPLIMLLLGSVTGFVVLSTVLPLLDLMCVM